MIRVCAWCRLFLRLSPPYANWELTHTICLPCRSRLGQEAPPALDSSAMRTLIVSRDGYAIDAKTALELAGSGPPTLVLVDRRRTERRRLAAAVCPDQRRHDRRTSPPASWRRGFMLRWPVAVPETAPFAAV
jgi:hypothetical protein